MSLGTLVTVKATTLVYTVTYVYSKLQIYPLQYQLLGFVYYLLL